LVLSSRRTQLPAQCQGFELFGKTDQAGTRYFGSRSLGHLPVFARPLAKLIRGQEIERHMIWHQSLSHDPVKPDLFAGITTFSWPLVTVNPCHCQ
jgi:hypothetical protein